VPKLKLPEVLLFCIAAAPVFRIGAFLFYQVPTAAGNLLMPCRIDALLLGALAACCLRSQDLGRKLIENRARIYAAFALLLAGVLVMCFTMPHFASVQMTIWGRSWLALFYVTLLLIPLLDRNGLVAALLRNRLLQRVGTVSYGVYLLHQPVFGLTAMLISGGESNSVASHLFLTILAAVFTFATAALLYQWVEKPILKIGHAHKF